MALNDKELIYYMMMEQALEDNYLSMDEGNILDIITAKMDIPSDSVKMIIAHFKGKEKIHVDNIDYSLLDNKKLAGKYRSTFKAIVKEALKDEQITRDEFALINALRDIIGISQDERQAIYNEVREELSQEKTKPGVMDRVQNFLFSS